MGGLICSIGEFINLILEHNTNIIKEDRVIIIVMIFILCGALLTALGLFDNLVQIFGAGLFIPITGFSNAVCSEAMEYKSEGPIYGIGANMFKLAGSVITYGVFTSIILSLIYSLFI
jgi:stage V sporulation protein AC